VVFCTARAICRLLNIYVTKFSLAVLQDYIRPEEGLTFWQALPVSHLSVAHSYSALVWARLGSCQISAQPGPFVQSSNRSGYLFII
jgi:hypothetical protein